MEVATTVKALHNETESLLVGRVSLVRFSTSVRIVIVIISFITTVSSPLVCFPVFVCFVS